MSQSYFPRITAVYFCLALAACGGGGGSDNSTKTSQTQGTSGISTGNNSTGSSSGGSSTSGATPGGSTGTPAAGNATSSGNSSSDAVTVGSTMPSGGTATVPSSSGAGSTPPAPAFTAQLVSAPLSSQPARFLGEDVEPFSNTVRFEVSGTNLGNVELVSARNEANIYARFTVSADRTRAVLDWRFNERFQGRSYDVYHARVLAWDVPPGAPGNKIEVMAPRTYYVRLPLGCGAMGTCGGTAP